MRRLVLAVLLAACSAAEPPAPTSPSTSSPPPADQPSRAALLARVQEAQTRLQGSRAGQIVWKAIEAHGGLTAWHGAGTLAFDFDYKPLDAPERRMFTRNEVDLWRARVRQTELGEGADARLGWDGEVSWLTPGPEAFPYPARFWALTPYYFTGVPFVFADPGTRFELLPTAEVAGRPHEVVKITYEDGTGDSPDDYYILYVDAQTHTVGALRYIVAYPGFFPEGGSSPEKYMRYAELVDVGPLKLVGHIQTHAWDPDGARVGAVTTDVRVTNHALGSAMPARIFSPPPGVEGMREMTGR